MTLLVKPSIEFLDEPCKDFDPISRRAIKKMIMELKKMDSAVLLTTNRMDEAEEFCDKIAIIVNGHIVCVGSPNYILQSYGGGYEITAIVDISKSDYIEAYSMI